MIMVTLTPTLVPRAQSTSMVVIGHHALKMQIGDDQFLKLLLSSMRRRKS